MINCGPRSIAFSPVRLPKASKAIETAWLSNLRSFRAPWWLRDGHLQTLAAAYWTGRLPHHRAVERRVHLPDGDILAVHDDCPVDWEPGGRAMLMGHGLGGCHRSPLLARLARKLCDRGVRVFRFDMRGCGAGAGLARRPYHAGRSDDLAEVVQAVLGWCASGPHATPALRIGPPPSLVLMGISLSGNILLKYLGENPARVPSAVKRAIAVNPPIDLARSVANLRGPMNRWYDHYFVTALRRHIADHARRLPDAPIPTTVLAPRRMEEFDDWYTAPMSGYATGADYYQRCSAAQFIPQIQLPTVVLTSRNDPMVPVDIFESSHSAWPEAVRLGIIDGGGHLGYIAKPGIDPDRFWLDWRIVELATAA